MSTKDINSNDLMMAMLRAQLSGNEIKVMLAYVSKGGWKAGTEVFLPESVKEEYGLSDSTVKRARKTLVEGGWMKPTGNKSQWGCDKYTLHVPAAKGGSKRTEGSVKMTPGVGQNDLGGRSIWSTEVTKEVTKRSNEGSNKVEGSALRASHDSGKPSSSPSLKNRNDKDDQDTTGAPRRLDSILIDSYVPVLEPVLIGATEERGVGQNDLPYEFDENGELVW